MDAAGQFAQVIDGALELLGGGGQPVPDLRRRLARRPRSGAPAGGRSSRHEALLRAVVEVALHPAALLLGGDDQAGPRRPDLLELGLQRASSRSFSTASRSTAMTEPTSAGPRAAPGRGRSPRADDHRARASSPRARRLRPAPWTAVRRAASRPRPDRAGRAGRPGRRARRPAPTGAGPARGPARGRRPARPAARRRDEAAASRPAGRSGRRGEENSVHVEDPATPRARRRAARRSRSSRRTRRRRTRRQHRDDAGDEDGPHHPPHDRPAADQAPEADGGDGRASAAITALRQRLDGHERRRVRARSRTDSAGSRSSPNIAGSWRKQPRQAADEERPEHCDGEPAAEPVGHGAGRARTRTASATS